MKDSITIELDENNYVEVHFECWAAGKWMDYDVPPDPSGHEIEKVEFHSGKSVIDITSISEELASALNYDKVEEAINEHIENQ
tara:strand:- start:14173 stop:14421 length:249 start_codon:yes stop_codon:yes gene_type:complete